MKTILSMIFISVFTGYLCLSYGIGNNDVYIYKVAKYCGELSRARMMYTDSYQVKHLSVAVKARDNDYLEQQIQEEEGALNKFYQYSLDDTPLYLYGFFVDVAYHAKNGLNKLTQGTALCEFDTFSLYNEALSFPKIKKIEVGGNTYYPDDIELNFNEKKAGLFDVSSVGFFDKLDFLFHKNNIDIVFN